MNTEKAEFWLCISRAFLPPVDPVFQASLRTDLANDLDCLAGKLHYPISDEIDKLRSAISRHPDGEALLVTYSRLFLVPGEAHPHLNTGFYSDGALHGDTVRRISECYSAFGLIKDELFNDLPDHVAVQLEFVARLLADESSEKPGASSTTTHSRASEFFGHFIFRWAPLLRGDLQSASLRLHLPANPWLHLAEIVEQASLIESIRPEPVAESSNDAEIMRLRRKHAGRMPDMVELDQIRAKLAEQGFSTAHIDVPLEHRNAEDGLTALDPPNPPHHALHTRQG